MTRKAYLIVVIALLAVLMSASLANAQMQAPLNTLAQAPVGTAFTYQGRLTSGGSAVNDTCDFEFSLWHSATGSTGQVGSTQSLTNVSVSNGLFTVPLDFGSSAFTGDARWLETAVRCPAGSGTYTNLSPRQELTAAPYALHAVSASQAASFNVTNQLTVGGNVGIGTASPPGVRLEINDSSDGGLLINGPENDTANITFRDVNVGPTQDFSIDYASETLRFFTSEFGASSPVVAIRADNRNVGIGTTNPQAALHIIHSNATAGGLYIDNYWASGGVNNTHFDYPDGKNYIRGTTIIGDDGSNVGIGTTNPQAKLHVVGDIEATGNVCAFFPGNLRPCLSTVSDARLKTNVVPLGDVLDKIEQVRGISFAWNDEAQSQGLSKGHHEIGVIAQEVEAVFPEVVYTVPDGYKAVEYSRLSAVLIEAVKQLRAEKDAEIAALKIENAALQQRLGDLESRLTALEQAAGVNGGTAQPVADLMTASPIWLLGGGLLVVGLVGRRWNTRSGSRK